jgi:sec-independent protein translocase protein TatB
VFGINGPEFLVLALLALLVVGPERLPQYAAQLGRLVRDARKMASGARDQVRAELGPEFDDIDWQKLDPRQYDPRRIVREALTDAWTDEAPGSGRRGATAASAVAASAVAAAASRSSGADTAQHPVAGRDGSGRAPAPFDTEAT